MSPAPPTAAADPTPALHVAALAAAIEQLRLLTDWAERLLTDVEPQAAPRPA